MNTESDLKTPTFSGPFIELDQVQKFHKIRIIHPKTKSFVFKLFPTQNLKKVNDKVKPQKDLQLPKIFIPQINRHQFDRTLKPISEKPRSSSLQLFVPNINVVNKVEQEKPRQSKIDVFKNKLNIHHHCSVRSLFHLSPQSPVNLTLPNSAKSNRHMMPKGQQNIVNKLFKICKNLDIGNKERIM